MALCSIFESEAASIIIAVLLAVFYLLRGTKPKQKKAVRTVQRPTRPVARFVENSDHTSNFHETAENESKADKNTNKEATPTGTFDDEGIRATETTILPVERRKVAKPQIHDIRKAFIIGEILNRKQY